MTLATKCSCIISPFYRVRVANELGAGNGKGAKFATKVSVVQSTMVGVLFAVIILIFQDKLTLLFSSNAEVHDAVDKFSYLLAFTILLNSVQPVLSGKTQINLSINSYI